MLRRTQPTQGLPLIKLGTLLIRQMTKPMVGRLVASTKEHPMMMQLCVALGRLSMGTTGALRERGRHEEKREIERQDAERQRMERQQKKEELRAYLKEGVMQDAVRLINSRLSESEAAWQAERDVLRSQIRVMKERLEKVDSTNPIVDVEEDFPKPKGPAATPTCSSVQEPSPPANNSQAAAPQDPPADENKEKLPPSLPPAKKASHWSEVGGSGLFRSKLQDRYYDHRVPESALRDGGAEVLADMVVYFIMATILVYEYTQSKISEQRKEDVQNARLLALEAKVNELVDVHRKEGGGQIRSLASVAPALPSFSFLMWPVKTVRLMVKGDEK